MNYLQTNTIIETLKLCGSGMLGIFVVMILIALLVYCFTKLSSK